MRIGHPEAFFSSERHGSCITNRETVRLVP